MGPAGKNRVNATKTQPKHHLKATANLFIFMMAVSKSPFVTTALKNWIFVFHKTTNDKENTHEIRRTNRHQTLIGFQITFEGDLDQA